jgi:hypothetical protein
MKKILFITTLFLSYIANASIIADYAPRDINLEDTIQLTLTVDGATKSGSPNLVPLLKDFEVLSTGRSYSFESINGKNSSQTRWTVILKPKHAGTITIPPISIGSEQSQALTLNIRKSSAENPVSDNNNSTYTILKTKINEEHPFINQQTIYTVKLYNRQQLFDGQYKAPEVENALIVPLGEGKTYQTTLQNQIYNVEEISYAIFPQKDGKITIIPPEFTANVVDGFSPTKIHLKAKPTYIIVKPLSTGKNISEWLAAENVTLHQEYEDQKAKYNAGDTIIRHITLKATGMVAQLLPKLSFSNNANYNIYADKPHIENSLIDGKIIATATYKITYLLTKAANSKIPEIKIPWYNINLKKECIASLPAKDIFLNSITTKQVRTNPKKIILKAEVLPKAQPRSPSILYMSIFVIMIIAITTIILKFKIKSNIKPSINPSLNNILKACKANDPVNARQAILALARQEWPELKILNLNNIPIDNPDFKKEITLLTEALYGKGRNIFWDGTNLLQFFSKLKLKKPRYRKKKSLPPIYLH